ALIEVARRWKTQINESAKVWAFFEEMPEAQHNAIVAWGLPPAIARATTMVLLRSEGLDHPRVVLRYDLMRRLLADTAIDKLELTAPGESALAQLLDALRRGLSLSGFDVTIAKEAGQALTCVESGWPDVMVLDIMMPGLDGLSLCRLVRERSPVRILMLTALDSVPDRVAGLQMGADDYLIKPCALDELIARIQALL